MLLNRYCVCVLSNLVLWRLVRASGQAVGSSCDPGCTDAPVDNTHQGTALAVRVVAATNKSQMVDGR